MSDGGPSRHLPRCSDLVAIGDKRTLPGHRKSVARDPDRHFAAVNYRSAKALLDHFIGNGEQCRRYGKAEHPGGL
jgi:hypothetical protein